MNLWYWVFIATVLASPGDRNKRFKRCVRECDRSNCRGLVTTWHFQPYDPYLSFLNWDCFQDCDYQCQQIITKERIQNNRKIVQFHGKWPFKRIFGIQEFFSTIFSLGNLYPHLKAFFKLKNHISSNSIINHHLYIIIFSNIVTCLAWTASTIFHIRDFLITERLDYFLAGATVLSGFYTVFCRLFKLYLPENSLKFYSFTFGCLSLYIGHVTRLIVDWSYTYNMQANIFIAILQNLGLYYLCYQLYYQYYTKPPMSNHSKYTGNLLLPSFFNQSSKLYCLYPLLLSTIIVLGMSLEIFDFPPIWDLIDAHSLWHLVTIIPVVFGWYDWLIWDIKENIVIKKD
ncbi:protein Per1p [[Candida] jaroonii]|uniref:Protein Per1p n=1 Tax=[Candida] jaroonii TaxID=467808 RepID=A0ACA9YBB6_9ASCO|nr:protein Per1p [[Candida] jaroonii]